MAEPPLYDSIGQTYAEIRRPDPRLANRIWKALGDARTVVNVGAGSGSYEPPDRNVIAVEPSAVMIAQRGPGAASVVQATAEDLPFANGTFDAAMAVLTLHHWRALDLGLSELTRVARSRVVIVTFDPRGWPAQWIVRDYLPELLKDEATPSLINVLGQLPPATVEPLLMPRDCTDRMFAALWARPEEYLDPRVRAATSVWHQLPAAVSKRALDSLRYDLESGRWDERYGHLRTTPEWDVGLRLIRAELANDLK
jgi:SAM-dependent methyltransferase